MDRGREQPIPAAKAHIGRVDRDTGPAHALAAGLSEWNGIGRHG